MKTPIAASVAIIVAALTVTFSPGVAHADGMTVQVKPKPSYHLDQQDLTDMQQAFALTNGQTMKFSTRMSHIFVQVDSGARVEIFPVAKNRFKSDAGTEFEFRDERETVAVANFGLLPMAEAPAQNLVLARR